MLVVNGAPELLNVMQREQGFHAELAARFPQVPFLGVAYAYGDRMQAATFDTARLRAHPDLLGVRRIHGAAVASAAVAVERAGALAVTPELARGG